MSSQEEINQSIARFCSYFERQLEVISKIDIDWNALPGSTLEDYQVRFYQKILLVSGLDALAGIRFPKSNHPRLNGRNRERLVRFVKEFGNWPEGELVSIPFLKNRLDSNRLSEETLTDYVNTKLANLDIDAGGQIPITSIDEQMDNLMKLAATEKGEESIEDCQHFSLLYRYRNYLVHEWREPGSSMEIDSLSREPYYHGYIDDPEWYLVYPLRLFQELFNSSVSNMKEYLLKNSIDPYLHVKDTSRW